VAPQKPVDQTQTTSQREDAKIIQQAEEAEERETLQFRAAFMSTQMMVGNLLFLFQRLAPHEYIKYTLTLSSLLLPSTPTTA